MLNKLIIDIIFLSVSVSFLIMLLLFAKSLFKAKSNPRIIYIIWLALLIRLLIPFALNIEYSPEVLPFANSERYDAGSENHGNPTETTLTIEYPLPGEADLQPSSPLAVIQQAVAESPGMLPWISAVWLIGFCTVIIITLTGEYLTYRRLKNARDIGDNLILDTLEDIQLILGITRNIKVVECRDFSSPAVYGLRNVTLVIPDISVFNDMPFSQARNILIHELTHIKNRDNWVRILCSLLRAIHWFNPLIWIMVSNIANTQEILCDQKVLSTIPEASRRTYADLIIGLYGKAYKRLTLQTPSFLSRKMLMKERVLHVIFYRKTGRFTAALGILFACTFFMFSFVNLIPGTNTVYASLSDNDMRNIFNSDEQGESNDTYNTEPIPTDAEDISPDPSAAPNGGNPEVSSVKDTVYNLTPDGHVIFDEPEIEYMIAIYFSVPMGKITPEQMEKIYSLEVWGELYAVNDVFSSLIQYYGNDGSAVAKDNTVIRKRGSITSLKDIEMMPNLHTLSVNLNDIEKHPDYSYLGKLTTIRMLDSNLTDISFLSSADRCAELYLCGNRITDVSVLTGMYSLQAVQLDYNNIKELPDMSGLRYLSNLTFSRNSVGSLTGIAGNTNLILLDANYNMIEDISPLLELSSLKVLRLGHNRLRDISVIENLGLLNELNLFENYLSDISALSELQMISILNLSNNSINDFSHLKGLDSLRYLYIENNLGSADPSILESLTWLVELRAD